jgi:outer membrane biosynthesis protein TonB
LKEIETVFGTLASIKNKQVYSDEVLEKLVALDRAGNGVADPVEVDKLLRPAKPKNDLAPEPDDPFGADEPAKPAPTPETKVEAKVESKPAPAPAPTPAPKAETKQAPAPAPVVETPATDDDIDSIFA